MYFSKIKSGLQNPMLFVHLNYISRILFRQFGGDDHLSCPNVAIRI